MRGLGIDAGAGSISLAVVEDGRLIYSRYALHKGDAKHTLCEMLETMKKELNHTYPGVIEYAAVNRAAAFLFPEAGEMEMADRVTALLAGQKLLYPEAQSILEIGAQTSCFLTGLGRDQVMEYAVNGECAAGTGAFFEDQMYRLGLPLESYSDYTDRATSVPRLAGRCSVFAKTDLIHRQQEGVSAEDILLGLAYAVVRNFKTSVVRKHPVRKPVLLSGGVVKNRGVIRAVKEIFGLEDGEMVCDDCGTVVSAAGLAMLAMEWKVRVDWEWICGETSEPVGTRMCENADTCDMGMACSVEGQEAASENQEPGESGKMLPPYQYEKDQHHKTRTPKPGESMWLGVDVGSTSTNLVLIGENQEVLDYCYIRTSGNPVRAVEEGLAALKPTMDLAGTPIVQTAVTGSGRYLIAKRLGTEYVLDEITAQARAASYLNPDADTVFEIGGQDSKYISVKHSQVVDFEMNKVCAAGTGSFIEEQAGRLGIPLAEIGPMALAAEHPVELGERCTVLMESKILSEIAAGAGKEDLCAGLCRSIVRNYLNRVVANKKVGQVICLQGGIIHNEGIVSAFYEMFGERLRITPYYDVTGAYGAALEAKAAVSKHSADQEKNTEIYKKNREWFYAGYNGTLLPGRKTIGIPQSLMMYKFFPMAYKYFTELGFNVLLSEESCEEIIRISQDVTQEETCYPVKLLHGHMEHLARKGVDYLFIPCIRTIRHATSGVEHNYGCVYMQTAPKMVAKTLRLEERGIHLLAPVLDMDIGQPQLAQAMIKTGVQLGKEKEACQAAMKVGAAAMQLCDRKSEELGKEILASLKPDDKVLVLVTRNYGISDPVLNMGIPGELLKRGCKVLNLAHLQGHSMYLAGEYPNLYWPFSQHILTGAKIIKNHPNLYAVYLTNHGCGPDTMISHMFREIMGDKPYLSVEVDEHQSAVGVVTRIEAFLNSRKHVENVKAGKNVEASEKKEQVVCRKREEMEKCENTEAHEKAAEHGQKPCCSHSEISKSGDYTEYAPEYDGIRMSLERSKDRTIILPPLSIYTELYAKYLRYQGCFVQVGPDYTREDLESGKAESISKEYATFSAMAGQVLRLAGCHGDGAGKLPETDRLPVRCDQEQAKESMETQMQQNFWSYLVPQTEGAEAEGMAAMVIRALLKQHGTAPDRISLYTPYTEHLFRQKDWEQIWQLCMMGDALLCLNQEQRKIELDRVKFPLVWEDTKKLLTTWHELLPKAQKRVFLFGSAMVLHSSYLNRSMPEAVRKHGFTPVSMMLSEYLWFWIRESGKEIPQEATEQLSWFNETYWDIWGTKASLEEQFARLAKDYPDVVGGNIRYLCSLIAAGIPDAAGSMLLMPTYSNSGSVIELMKQPSPVPFLHFQAEGSGEADEAERRDIWLNLISS